MPSPLFFFNSQDADLPLVTTSGATVHFSIANQQGVNQVLWAITGRSQTSLNIPDIILDDAIGYEAHLVLPSVDGYGASWGLSCTINGGLLEGSFRAEYTAKSGIYVAAGNGFLPIFLGETFEYDSETGYANRLNPFLGHP